MAEAQRSSKLCEVIKRRLIEAGAELSPRDILPQQRRGRYFVVPLTVVPILPIRFKRRPSMAF